jgi:predicted GIY-YIG superfamily endonuclease
MKDNKIHSVYLLTNGQGRYYIGYSNNVNNNPKQCRYRTHALKLKHSARATKKFKTCYLLAKIEGFPTKNSALSMEWYCKRKFLKILKLGHQQKINLNSIHFSHNKLKNFFAPLLLHKFKVFAKNLTIYVQEPMFSQACLIHDIYEVRVANLNKPFLPDHLVR